MKHYNFAFVGLGSIGKRHFQNICSIIESQGATYSIDLYRSNVIKEISDDFASHVRAQYLYDDEIKKNCYYDAVFVTNPTSLHFRTVNKFFENARAFFIEKPVFNSYDIEDTLIDKIDSKISYVSCPMRFNPVLSYVKDNIDCSKAYSVRAISSSYLPDWRPGQDYRKCYSAHTDMGGGVDIDLVHEWDYLTYLFGMPTTCQAIIGKISNLEIDSNDIAAYIGRNETTSFELHLDYFGRKSLRTLDIFLPDETVCCNMLEGTIHFMMSGKKMSFEKDRNIFHIAQMRHFLDILDGKINNDSTVSHAVKILKLTKGIV